MKGKIVLCADSQTLEHPEFIGLDDIRLDKVPWLIPISDPGEARAFVKESESIESIWVISSDDVDALNLAASLRKDDPVIEVVLALSETSGSLLSRASSAGVTEVLGLTRLCERFAVESARRNRMEEIGALAIFEGEGERSALTGARGEPMRENVQKGLSHSGSFIATFLSGSGGAGKSTITTLAAYLCARRGWRTLAFDADLQFGDLGDLARIQSRCSVDDVLEDPSRVATLVDECAVGEPCLISAPQRLERFETIAQHVCEVLECCSRSFEVILVNTGSSWAEYHASLLESSDAAVFILDQRASSVRACKHALDLCARMGIASGAFSYALNRCHRSAHFTAIDVATSMQGVHVMELNEGGSDVEELLGAGLAHELIADRNDLCVSIDSMLDEMLPTSSPKGMLDGGIRRQSVRHATGLRPRRRLKARRKRNEREACEDGSESMGRGALTWGRELIP